MENLDLEIDIAPFISDAKDFFIEKDSLSYLRSYPHFIKYFLDIQDEIDIHNLTIGIHFVYGWMPTIFEFKVTDNFDEAIIILNKAKSNAYLLKEEYETLKKIFNGSMVGTSKLLHFINPQKYAIWDSRVHRYVRKTEIVNSIKFTFDIGNVTNYQNYLLLLSRISNSSGFEDLYKKINHKVKNSVHGYDNYDISKFRAIELIMFKNGKK